MLTCMLTGRNDFARIYGARVRIEPTSQLGSDGGPWLQLRAAAVTGGNEAVE